MKLSISNIAWEEIYDKEMYEFMTSNEFTGLEIAPTRIIEKEPYIHLDEAKRFYKGLKEKYNLEISSIQSIWYGRNENIFESIESRKVLLDYTKQAINFASIMKCRNIVFGCPKNRSVKNKEQDYKTAINFFDEIGNYAQSKNVCFSIEPNPTIYNTNFINTTKEAIELVKEINNNGIRVNIDLGAIIQNHENIDILKDNIHLINHVHISEPNLEIIQKRELHGKIIELLNKQDYQGYISIEMKNHNDIKKVKEIIIYIKQIAKEGKNNRC